MTKSNPNHGARIPKPRIIVDRYASNEVSASPIGGAKIVGEGVLQVFESAQDPTVLYDQDTPGSIPTSEPSEKIQKPAIPEQNSVKLNYKTN